MDSTPLTSERIDPVYARPNAFHVQLVDISVGGVIALRVCLEHPAEVASLVLSGGLAHAPPWFVLQRTIARITPEPLLERALAPLYSGGSAEYAKIAVEDFRRFGKHAYLAALGELAELDLRPRLSRVSVPTLVSCGSKDRVNIPLSRELAAGIQRAELQIVSGATHLWNLQQPVTFNQTIATFLQRTAP